MNKKRLLIGIGLVVLIFGLTVLVIDRGGTEDPEIENEEEEVSVSESLDEVGEILEMESDLIEIDEQIGLDESILEKYYEIENMYFIIRDKYYEESISDDELRNEVDNLLIEVEKLEEELNKLI